MSESEERKDWSWRERLLFWGPVPLGITLIVFGDTFERVIGAGFVMVPAIALCWGVWRVLRHRRAARRVSGHTPPND